MLSLLFAQDGPEACPDGELCAQVEETADPLSFGGIGGTPAKKAPEMSATGAIRYSEPTIEGGLGHTLMKAVVDRMLPKLDHCVTEHGGSGEVTITFVVAEDGRVSSSAVEASTTKNAELDACLLERFAEARFPMPTEGLVVTASWPLVVIEPPSR